MTTTIASSKKTSGGKSPLLVVIVLAAVIVSVASVLPAFLQQPHRIPLPGGRGNIEVHYNEHAGKHPESPLVRSGCEQGPEMIWKHKFAARFIFLCRLPNAHWGIMIVEKVKGIWEEMTSFVPEGEGTHAEALAYLRSVANPFKGLLP